MAKPDDLRSDETKYNDDRVHKAVERERERIARAVERLDNTMMNGNAIAAYIRKNLTPTP